MPISVIPFPQIDPVAVTIPLGFVDLPIRWYALAYIAGLLLGWRLCVWLVKRPALWPENRAPMTPAQPEELLTWMTLGVVLGGRIGFVLFYAPLHFIQNPLDALQIWQGGMSFHGGFLGVIVGVILFCRVRGLPLLQVGDAVALATPLGIFFGRMANFINGELWGRPTDVPWAMVFPAAGPEPRHPSQLYEGALEGMILGLVMWWLAVRKDWLKWPGAMIGVFFIGYGLGRTVAENFRQGNMEFMSPNNPVGQVIRFGSAPDSLGFTMGQVLSMPMLAVGAAFLWLAFRRRQPVA
ncbi:MAG: prolipoprotein diacylglyceryl transferase [Pseudomonadota bacterium]